MGQHHHVSQRRPMSRPVVMRGPVDELIAERRIETLREGAADAMRQTLDRPKVRGIAAKIHQKLAGCWGPSAAAAELIGAPEREYRRCCKGKARNLDILELERIQCLMGICQSLGTLYSGCFDRVDRWLRRRDNGDTCRGKTPYVLLVGASPNVLCLVRQLLAAESVWVSP